MFGYVILTVDYTHAVGKWDVLPNLASLIKVNMTDLSTYWQVCAVNYILLNCKDK